MLKRGPKAGAKKGGASAAASSALLSTPKKSAVPRGPPIEDALLPNFAAPNALPPLIADFCGLPAELVAPVLMTWDFLVWFAALTQQTKMRETFATVCERFCFSVFD